MLNNTHEQFMYKPTMILVILVNFDFFFYIQKNK